MRRSSLVAVLVSAVLALVAIPVAAHGDHGGGRPADPGAHGRERAAGRGALGGSAAAGRPAAPPPQPDPTDYRALAPTLSKPVYPQTRRSAVDVPMADGTHLYVEVVRPEPKAYGNGPWPVVLEASPYHGTLADRAGTRIFPDAVDANGGRVGLTGYFAPRGYAVVMVDLRGTGRSSGCLDHLGANDARDLKEVVEWAAGRPWSNGRVGMAGHSYVGATTVVAAAQRPKGLVTIVPSAGLASMYDHQFNKGVPWLLQWAGPIHAYEQLALERHAPGGDSFGEDMETFGCGLPQSAALAGSGQVTGKYEAWHAARDWNDEAAAVDIPVFMVHGIHDNAARIPAAEWFFARRFSRPGDKVWLGQWDHGSTNGRCGDADGIRVDHPTCRFDQFKYALHAWFDRHLAQRDVDTGPGVEVFLNGAKPTEVTAVVDPEALGAKAFARRDWTAPSTTLSLFPDATDGSLDFAPPAKAGADTFGVFADALLAGAPSEQLEFRSRPLAKDVVLLGLPQLELDVSMSYGQIVDIVTTLWRQDVAGNRQRVSFCGIQPQLRNGIETVTPVVPGEVMRLPLQCFTTAQWIPAGQRLVLEVGTRSPHHASRGSDARMTLHTGPDGPAYRLPRMLGVRLVDDVPLRDGSTGRWPLGPAQPAIHGTVALPAPDLGLLQAEGTTVATYEFTSKPGFDNARTRVVVTDVGGDVDIWLDAKRADGTWVQIAEGANGVDIGAPETLDHGRLHPGAYRVRISNFASVPGDINIDITFKNQAGKQG